MSPTTSPDEPRTPRLYHGASFSPWNAVGVMLAAAATLLLGAGVAVALGVPLSIAPAIGELAMLGCAVLIARAARQPRQALGIAGASGWLIGAAILIGLSMWFWNLLLSSQLAPPNPRVIEALDRVVREPPLAIVTVTAALAPAVCEEVIFRGVVLRGLASRLPAWAAVLLSAALFGMFHMNFVQLLPTFTLGIALGVLALRAGSIVPAVIAHFLNNAMAIAITHDAGGPLTRAFSTPFAVAGTAVCLVEGIAIAACVPWSATRSATRSTDR